ncbi:hypothetical protein ACFQKB_07695 [Actinomadura yumaensis]|uniref:Uncharacterized protein n=1 Tax=Actinomadura yumaensis TaxID=111807 RepID=A0ABW2CCX2_9ACTN
MRLTIPVMAPAVATWHLGAPKGHYLLNPTPRLAHQPDRKDQDRTQQIQHGWIKQHVKLSREPG